MWTRRRRGQGSRPAVARRRQIVWRGPCERLVLASWATCGTRANTRPNLSKSRHGSRWSAVTLAAHGVGRAPFPFPGCNSQPAQAQFVHASFCRATAPASPNSSESAPIYSECRAKTRPPKSYKTLIAVRSRTRKHDVKKEPDIGTGTGEVGHCLNGQNFSAPGKNPNC